MFRIFPIILFVAFFGTVLFGDRQFGYRDGVHYYFPLYQYIQEELAAGRLPLWNPYENLGQPLAANPTAAVFYPGKLIFFLPFDYTTLYGWFVAGHVLLAAFLAFRLAKAWRCSDSAAALASIVYAFGGNVLFQHTNAPFLIGAAWFPEALLQAERMFRLKSYRNAVLLGTVLALMILGGDPQAAYHAILCAIFFFLIKSRGWRRTRRNPRIAERVETQRTRELRRSVFRKYDGSTPGSLLMLCGLFTMLGLAAVQILPAWELSRLSDRSLPDHADAVYLYSVPIWRFVEFFWPNAGGVEFPINARWFHGDDVWVPSFYMGLVPMLLALFALRFVPGRAGTFGSRAKRDVFLTWMLIVFVLGSLGKWGGVDPLLNLLPGYGMFRFPAKLLVVAALPLAILAARGFDRLFRDDRFVARFSCGWLASWGAVFFAACWVWQNTTGEPRTLYLSVPECSLFGLFNGYKAFGVAIWSNFQVVVLLLFLVPWNKNPFLFLIPWNKKRELLNTRWARYLLILVSLDLFLANNWMVATVLRTDFREKSLLLDVIRETATAGRSSLSGVKPRIYRFPAWYPLQFKYTSSKNRLSEIVRWERATLSPKYSLSEKIGVVDVLGTMYPKDFYAVAGGLRWEIKHGEPGDLEKRLKDLGVEYVVAPCGKMLEAELLLTPEKGPLCTNLWKLHNPRPRNYAVFEPNWLEMDVDLAEPETVTIPEQYWPGWRAFVEGKEYPIRPVDKIFRGVDLPSGKHRLIMRYEPNIGKIGAVVSILTILVVVLNFAACFLKIKQLRWNRSN